MDAWIAAAADEIAARAPAELEHLVAISSPSGDVAGADAAIAYALTLAPDGARVERPPCSTSDHADDLVVTVTGSGSGRIVLLGHVDTVHAHEVHRPLTREGPNLLGSGSVDMKGGDILALGVLRALAQRARHVRRGRVAARLRRGVARRRLRAHARFAGWDACLCFEGGQLTRTVRRRSSSSARPPARCGCSPMDGRRIRAPRPRRAPTRCSRSRARRSRSPRCTTPPARRTSPRCRPSCAAARRSTSCRRRASCCATCAPTTSRRSTSSSPASPRPSTACAWSRTSCASGPGWTRERRRHRCSKPRRERLGRPIHGADRGGASDASYLAPVIDVSVDGLGPRGGGAHTPGEYIVESSLRERAEVALALASAVLA